jgi:hypothetical protein
VPYARPGPYGAPDGHVSALPDVQGKQESCLAALEADMTALLEIQERAARPAASGSGLQVLSSPVSLPCGRGV